MWAIQMKRLFICNTPFQCLTSLIIAKYTDFESESDIVISDLMNGYQGIIVRMKESGIFQNVNVFYFRDCFSNRKENRVRYLSKQFICEFKGCPQKQIDEICKSPYDKLFITNTHCYINTILQRLKQQNENMEVNLVDEGYYTYTNMVKNDLMGAAQGKNYVRWIGDLLFRRPVLKNKIDQVYLMNPKLCCWEIPYPVISLPKVDIEHDTEFRNIINQVFSYEMLKDNYDRNYTFFEESFALDNHESDDMQLVDCMAEAVGRDNMTIKLHPRSIEDRFSVKGYQTNSQQGIPWEIIAANIEHAEKKTLVTISSGAIINSCILFEKTFQSILLYNCSDINWVKWDKTVAEFFRKYVEEYKENTFVPNDKEELVEYLKK